MASWHAPSPDRGRSGAIDVPKPNAGRDHRRRPVRPAARRSCCTRPASTPSSSSGTAREYVLGRIRAGVLEQVDGRPARRRPASASACTAKGCCTTASSLPSAASATASTSRGLTGGKQVMVYGQTEVTHDLMDARSAERPPTVYEARRRDAARLRRHRAAASRYAQGRQRRIAVDCDFIAGCDGFHGVCRASVPERRARAPTSRSIRSAGSACWPTRRRFRDELIYANHERGFALCSHALARRAAATTCSARSTTRSRLDATTPSGTSCACASTPRRRERLVTGPSIEKSIAPLRSFVAEPMRFGRLFLAGDAAHIVPPTGAKGLNLAASDVATCRARWSSTTASAATPGIDALFATPACAASGRPSASRGGSPR